MSKSYQEEISRLKNLTIESVIKVCKERVPRKYSGHPMQYPNKHPEINHGVSLLESEEALDCYIAAYGEMHMIKCRAALQNFPFEQLKGLIEIVDWACGQGIGSLCVVEELRMRESRGGGDLLNNYLEKITLIEPSSAALYRAEINLQCAISKKIQIETINKKLPSNNANEQEIKEIQYRCQNVIHIFSNILDIPQINLLELAKLVAEDKRKHYVLCVGPVWNQYRIDDFCSLFGVQEFFSSIETSNYSRLSNDYPITCKTKCFLYDNALLQTDYVPTQDDADSTSYFDECDYYGLALKSGWISKAFYDVYGILAKLQGENPNIYLLDRPSINGANPDFILVIPKGGIFIINVCEQDLRGYEFERGQNNKIDYKILVNQSNKDLKAQSPSGVLYGYKNDIVEILAGIEERMIYDENLKNAVKIMLFFTNEATKDKMGKNGRDRQFSLVYESKNINSAIKRLDCKDFDENICQGFLKSIKQGWHSFQDGKKNLNHLTPTQRNLAKSEAGKKQKIAGVAGSGKTQVLAFRAVNALLRTGGNVLILTFNKSLVNYLKYRINEVQASFSWNKVHITWYHRFFKEWANDCGLYTSKDSYDETDFFSRYKESLPKYDAIFIDEVQDFKKEWLQLINKYFLAENGEFVVFGDSKQNIYGRELDARGDPKIGAIIGGFWNNQLNKNLRVQNPKLIKFLGDFQRQFFDKEIPYVPQQASLINGITIKYSNLRHSGKTDCQKREIAEAVCKIIKNENFNLKDTALIAYFQEFLQKIDYFYRQFSRQDTMRTFFSYEIDSNLESIKGVKVTKKDDKNEDEFAKLHFTMLDERLKIATIASFKGWEAENVIFVLGNDMRGQDNELVYAALTRAKRNLIILNLDNKKYDEFFANYPLCERLKI